MVPVNVRNLEQIQETDVRRRSSRLGTLLLASVGGAAVVVATVMMTQRNGQPAQSGKDPLEALVHETKQAGPAPEKLEGGDVTFPGILSDKQSPTTALAAVKDERGRLVARPESSAVPGAPAAIPVPGDRLPVVPLPAGSLLTATTVTAQPRDGLAAIASSAAQPDEGDPLAPPGAAGGYQIQVASFKQQEDADKFATDLRKRGHRAFRLAAEVPGRGIWHRVRIGPFKTKFEANQYKKVFEKNERFAPFVVDPHQVKQREEARAAKLALRRKRLLQR